MKKYLVSGLGISEGGVGRLMQNLTRQATDEGFSIIARRNNNSMGRMLKSRKFINIGFELLGRFCDNFIFYFKLVRLNNAVVVFVHPQTAGFYNFLRLVKKNKVYLYVMDNSFFCIRSYNLHPESESECLRCLKTPRNALPACLPFPIKLSRSRNIKYLERLSLMSDKIYFLVQNSSQGELIKTTFGPETYTETVGLDTGEVKVHDNETLETPISTMSYDLVFHGAPHLAKGLRYFVELAENLSEFTAFIPASQIQCENVLARSISTGNIIFGECNWESGLKDAVKSANLVVNPSLWSAPIEGALQKSMHFGRRVATVESEFGYEKEFPASDTFIRLPRDVSTAADLLRKRFPRAVFPPIQSKMVSPNLTKDKINIFKWVSRNES